MARRRVTSTERTAPPDWQDTTRAGTKVRIRGERGAYVVRYEAGPDSPHGAHVALFGGPRQQFRNPATDLVVWPRPPRRKRNSEETP